MSCVELQGPLVSSKVTFRSTEWRLTSVTRSCLTGCGWRDTVTRVPLSAWLTWLVESVERDVHWDTGVCTADCFLLSVNNVAHGLLDTNVVDGFSRLCRDLSLAELGSDFLLLTVFFTHESDGVWEAEVSWWVLTGDDTALAYDTEESLEFICFCKPELTLDSRLISSSVLFTCFRILYNQFQDVWIVGWIICA